MSGFNMVAKTSKVSGKEVQRKGADEKMLVVLRMKGRSVKNLIEWEEGLRACFAMKKYTRFLYDYSSIRVPESELSRVEMQLVMNGMMDMRVKEVKKTRQAQEVIMKGEDGNDDEAKQQAEAVAQQQGSKTPAKKPRGRGLKGSVQGAVRMRDDDVDMEKYQENMRKNAEELAARQIRKQKTMVKRGVREVALFANPITHVALADNESNKNADIVIEFDGKFRKYEAENEVLVRARLEAWGLIVGTLKEIDVAVYKHIAIGDVYGLYSFVIENYHGSDRAELVREIVGDLQTLEKTKDEIFEHFVMRYEAILHRMKELSLVFDDDMMLEHVRCALEGSECKETRKCYGRMVDLYGDVRPKKLFEHMLPPMKNYERKMRVKYDLAMKKSEKVQKRMRQKEKRRTRDSDESSGDSSSDSSEPEGPESVGVHRVMGKPVDKDIAGVCLYFQAGKCFRNVCKYRHDRMSEEQLGRLKSSVKERAADRMKSIKCHECGKMGHVKARCPNKGDEEKKGAEAEVQRVAPRAVRVRPSDGSGSGEGKSSDENREQRNEQSEGDEYAEEDEMDSDYDSIDEEIGYTDDENKRLAVRLSRMTSAQLDRYVARLDGEENESDEVNEGEDY